jgi:hypothetical protein
MTALEVNQEKSLAVGPGLKGITHEKFKINVITTASQQLPGTGSAPIFGRQHRIK